MSKFKDLVAKIRTELSGDDNKDLLDKINPVLSEIKSTHESKETELADAIAVSKNNAGEAGKWRKDLRAEEKAHAETKSNSDNTGLTKERDDLKTENETLKTYKKTVVESKTQELTSWHEKVKTDPKFENVKARLVIPEEKDGKFDFSGLKEDEITKNITVMDDLNSLKYFGEPGKNTQVNDRMNFKTDDSETNGKDKVTDGNSLLAEMNKIASEEGIVKK